MHKTNKLNRPCTQNMNNNFKISQGSTGPNPGWGPVRVGALMAPYGLDFAEKILTLMKRVKLLIQI